MTTTNRTILVTGATGQQGGATARHLLDAGWRVRALVRDPAAPAAVALGRAGAELVRGDLDDAVSLAAALRDAYGVFSVQPSDDREVARGRAVVDAAAAAGVLHVVYSSTGGAPAQARYRELGKWEIENHLRASGLPATVLRPGAFLEDFATSRFGVDRGTFAVPYDPATPIQIIAMDDIGAFAALAFARPDEFVGRALDISGDARTAPEIAAAVRAATGRDLEYVRIPMDVVREHNPIAATVIDWVNEEYYTTDLEALRRLRPELMDLDTWLARTGAERFLAVLPPADA